MIKFLIGLVFVMLLSSAANANRNCGFKPFPPYGCSARDAVCICGGRYSNKCEWVFVDCQ